MSSVLTNEYAEFWINCPSDILMLIYKRLDVKSLINCIHVTKSWSDTVHDYCQHYKLWGKMVEEVINKRCIRYQEKSNLNEYDLFLNATHWLNIQNHIIFLNREYHVKHVNNISVLKGTLFVMSCGTFYFFDIKKSEMNEKCDTTCLNHLETSTLIAQLTRTHSHSHVSPVEGNILNILTLTKKLHENICELTATKNISHFYRIFKVHLNACYVIDIKNVLWVYTAHEGKWDCKALARYYGNRESISTIHIHDDDIYILLKCGDIFKVDLEWMKFERLFHLETPLDYFDGQAFMFDKYSVIINVPSYKIYDIYPQKGRKQTVVVCPDLSCCLEHGPVLITGYENGKIEIFLIDNLVNGNRSPALQFSLQSYSNLDYCRIKSIDVYEDTDGHHLFIASVNNIYELLINL